MYRNFSPILSNSIKLSRLNFDKHFITLNKIPNKTSFKQLPVGVKSVMTPLAAKLVVSANKFTNANVGVLEPLSEIQTSDTTENSLTPLSGEVEELLDNMQVRVGGNTLGGGERVLGAW
jgi:hypothetical protein